MIPEPKEKAPKVHLSYFRQFLLVVKGNHCLSRSSKLIAFVSIFIAVKELLLLRSSGSLSVDHPSQSVTINLVFSGELKSAIANFSQVTVALSLIVGQFLSVPTVTSLHCWLSPSWAVLCHSSLSSWLVETLNQVPLISNQGFHQFLHSSSCLPILCCPLSFLVCVSVKLYKFALVHVLLFL